MAWILSAKAGEDRLLGGFAGPVIIAEEYPVNLSRAISRIKIMDETGKKYQLKDARQKGVSYPEDWCSTTIWMKSHWHWNWFLRLTEQRSSVRLLKIKHSSKNRSTFAGRNDLSKIWYKWWRTKSFWNGNQTLFDPNWSEGDFETIRSRWNYLTSHENCFVIAHDIQVVTTVNEQGNAYQSQTKIQFSCRQKEAFRLLKRTVLPLPQKKQKQSRKRQLGFFKMERMFFCFSKSLGGLSAKDSFGSWGRDQLSKSSS